MTNRKTLIIRKVRNLSDIFRSASNIIKNPLIPITILLLLILLSCGKKSVKEENPIVYNLVAPDYIPIGFSDTVYLRLSVDDPQGLDDIDIVYFTFDFPDGSVSLDTFFMHDDGQNGDDIAGDGVFASGLTGPDTSQQTGDYIYHFTAKDNGNHQANIIDKTITAEESPAPYVYNLIAPDSLQKGSPVPAYLFLEVWDPQGLEDVDSVYFTVTRPDGSSNNYRFYMRDDGENGDSLSGDGIYTLGISPPSPENQSGDYVFHFTAKDTDEHQANVIDKIITAYDVGGPMLSGLKADYTTRVSNVRIFRTTGDIDFMSVFEVTNKGSSPDD